MSLEEGGAEFGDQFLGGVSLAPEDVLLIPVEATLVSAPVS